jgi:hypothetical protein
LRGPGTGGEVPGLRCGRPVCWVEGHGGDTGWNIVRSTVLDRTYSSGDVKFALGCSNWSGGTPTVVDDRTRCGCDCG